MALVVLCGGLWWFQRVAREHEIQALLERRALALQQKDLALYLSCFSPHYQSGTRTFKDLQADVSRWFSQFATIQFAFSTRHLEWRGANALVENMYKFSVTDTAGTPIVIENQELLEIRKEQTGWKIIAAHTLQQ